MSEKVKDDEDYEDKYDDAEASESGDGADASEAAIDDTAPASPGDEDVADWGLSTKKRRFGKEVLIAFGAIAVLGSVFAWVIYDHLSPKGDGSEVVAAGGVPGPNPGSGNDPFLPGATSGSAAENAENGGAGAENGGEFLPPVQSGEPGEIALAGGAEPAEATGPFGSPGHSLGPGSPPGGSSPLPELFATSREDVLGGAGRTATTVASNPKPAAQHPEPVIGGLDDAGGTLSTTERPFGLFNSTGNTANAAPALTLNEPELRNDSGPASSNALDDPFLPANEPLNEAAAGTTSGGMVNDPFAPVPETGAAPTLEAGPLLTGDKLANDPFAPGPAMTNETDPFAPANEPLTADNASGLGGAEPLIGGNEPLIAGNEPLLGANEPLTRPSTFENSPGKLIDPELPPNSGSRSASSSPNLSSLLDEPASSRSRSAIPGTPEPGSGGVDPFAPNQPSSGAAPLAGNSSRNPAGSSSPFSPREASPTTIMSDATVAPNSESYTIEAGDSYWSISRKLYGEGRYFRDLAEFNRAAVPDPERLKVGTVIQSPSLAVLRPGAVNSISEPVAVADATPTISPVGSLLEDSVTARRPVIDASDKPAGIFFNSQGYPMYRVGQNDNLTSISSEHLGRASRWKQVFAMNRDVLQSPTSLQIGMVLKLPADASKVPLIDRTSSSR